MKTILSLITLAALASSATAQSTISASAKHAWSGNTGWIDARPSSAYGFRFGEFSCAGWLWSPNIGWIDCGDGTPANAINYGNDSNTDYGVNHYGTGDLYGMAWSPNTGWINFGWATLDPGNPHRPRVNLITGNFLGYAWSANCGWISLAGVKTLEMKVQDSDGDGISDAFEIAYAGDLSKMNGSSDQDGDGVSDKDEYIALTNPLDPKSHLRVTRLERAAPHDGTATALTWTSSPARLYAIEGSNDLGHTQPWAVSSSDPQHFTPDAAATTTRTSVHPQADKRFFRVKSVVPLQP